MSPKKPWSTINLAALCGQREKPASAAAGLPVAAQDRGGRSNSQSHALGWGGRGVSRGEIIFKKVTLSTLVHS